MKEPATCSEYWFVVGGSVMVAGQGINLWLRGMYGAPVSTVAFVAIIAAFATWHGMLRYGFARVFAFGIVVTAISCGYEICSMLTGFPFGWYQYTDKIGPKVGFIPLVVPPTYFAMGYISWTVAQSLLSIYDNAISGARLFAVPIAASFVIVAWHLPIDPVHGTIGSYWIWRDGGPFFGVPLRNFAGWFLCVWTFFMGFAGMNRVMPPSPIPPIARRRSYWLLPTLMYASFTLDHLGALSGRGSVAVTTRDGHVWWTGDIYASMALLAIFTAVPIALNATYRIFCDLPPGSEG
ncbi:carotenoid biosynthesis protein [Sphingomonas sp. RT2P30]|uniref:carotenoid biosynthesis protein n=1 Tax=Parasphingomonas halimpatiens TaxID=3096162 RepID=UPI002FCB9910